VLGDEGRCYVSQELVGAYKSTILPLASILTPNQFEAELLTGAPVADEAAALAACEALHAVGPHTVVITSMDAASGSGSGNPQPTAAAAAAAGEEEEAGHVQGGTGSSGSEFITLVASTKQEQLPGRPSSFKVRIPKLHAYFTGTGDLLTALLLAWCARHPRDLATAVEKAVASLQGVLQHTAGAVEELQQQEAAAGGGGQQGSGNPLSSKERTAAVFRAKELRVVQAQAAIANPIVELRAESL